jgi:hypothetical protein
LIISTLVKVIGFIPALIYGYIYSKLSTKITNKTIEKIYHILNKPPTKFDIGTSTEHPLKSIILKEP